jgi:hypothetical protein
MAKDLSAYGVVVDLSDAGGTSTTAEYRRFIPDYFSRLHARADGRLKRLSVVFIGSPVLRVAARFLVGRMSQVPFTVDKNRTIAIEAVRAALDSE